MILILGGSNQLTESQATVSLYILAAGLLLIYALRGNHIIGWDIHLEYEVFRLTDESKQWSLAKLANPYNACLSITILPTILASFLPFPPEYIFKVLMQLIFATTPIGIFAIIKRVGASTRTSFLAGTLFMLQTWFIIQMPSLIRQEIAFFFFAMTLLLIVSKKAVTKRTRKLLLGVFTISMILSHYSTMYILIAVLALYLIYAIATRYFFPHTKKYPLLVGPHYLLFIIITTFLWNAIITQTTQNTKGALRDFTDNASKLLSPAYYQEGLDQLLFKEIDFNSEANIQKVYAEETSRYQKEFPDLILFPEETYTDFTPKPVKASKIPTPSTTIGLIATRFSQVVKGTFVILLPLIGSLYLLSRKHTSPLLYHTLLLTLSFLPLVAAVLFLPGIKEAYNVTRLHLQSLFLLGLPTIVGLYLCTKTMRITHPFFAPACVGVYFLVTSGLFYQIVGGEPFEHLNNFGNSYEKFYVTDGEAQAASWLGTHGNDRDLIQADIVANSRLYSYGHINSAIYDIFPSTIDQNAYVYLSSTNLLKKRAFYAYNVDFLSYTYPVDFLDSQKNLIYSNKFSRIYK